MAADTPSDTTSDELAYRHREGGFCLVCSHGVSATTTEVCWHADHGWAWRDAQRANEKLRDALKQVSTLHEAASSKAHKGDWALEQALDVITKAVDDGARKQADLEKAVKTAMARLDKGARVLRETKAALAAVMQVLSPEQTQRVAHHIAAINNSDSF
jgi:hypothetical protein